MSTETLQDLAARLTSERVAHVERCRSSALKADPARHWMPPGTATPQCGSRKPRSERAIDGRPVTCLGCIDRVLEDAAGLDDPRAILLGR